MADVLKETGEFQQSIPIYEQNIKDSEQAVKIAPNDIKLNRFLGIAYGGYSSVLFITGETEKALENLLKAQTIARQLSMENPDDTDLYRNIGVSCEGICKFAAESGNNSLAQTNALEGIQIMEKIAKDDADNLEAKYDVASLHNTYSDFLEKNNRWQEAFEHRNKVLETIVPLEKNENNPELYTADFFEFYAKFARVSAKLSKKDLAAKYCQKAENLNFQIEKTSGETQNLYANDFVSLGDAYFDLGNKEKAKSWFAKAVETWQNLQKANKFYPNQAKNLAEAEKRLTQF